MGDVFGDVGNFRCHDGLVVVVTITSTGANRYANDAIAIVRATAMQYLLVGWMPVLMTAQ